MKKANTSIDTASTRSKISRITRRRSQNLSSDNSHDSSGDPSIFLDEGKEISQLESTTVCSEGDLFLVRRTTSGTDKKINYTDFVNSIGNPAIDGFIAAVDPTDSNTIILTPANNARIPRYFVGMKISFVSPITSTANVKIRIGNLVAQDFVQYQTTSTVILGVNDYVEGVFITDKFHRINDLRSVANIYSNEYNVVLTTIDPSEQFTTLNLVSSIGIPKQSYYDGMAISFICPIDTKGSSQILIDSIATPKAIFEPDPEDFISLPLYANQIVRAIYKTAQGGFIKDRFNVEDPTIVPVNITQDPTEEEIESGEMPPLIIPPQNSLEYSIDNFSTGINSFTTIKRCMDKILSNFPNGAESGVKVTITVNTGTINAYSTVYTIDRDLSWITLRSEDKKIFFRNAKIGGGYIFTQIKGKFFTIEKDTVVKVDSTFLVVSGGDVNLKNINIIPATLDTILYLIIAKNSNITLFKCNIEDVNVPISIDSNTTLTVEQCIFKRWRQGAIFVNVRSSPSITVNVTDSNLKTSMISENSDKSIFIFANNGVKCTIEQIRSQARCSNQDGEILPNTKINNVSYNVSGGQN